MSTNYIDDIARDIGVCCGMTFAHGSPAERALLRHYAVLCLSTGKSTTNQHVHDAWSAWQLEHGRATHPCLVPFDELSPEKQALDTLYRDAIRSVADKDPTP